MAGKSCFRKCVDLDYLGATCFGYEVDELFVYQTPKVVVVKDLRLALIKYSLMVTIFCYIAVYQVAYNGEHFLVESIQGVHRLQWQQPTVGWCNPMDVGCNDNVQSLATLPYCDRYTGNRTWQHRKPCVISDAWELPMNLPTGTLMPTYIERYSQRKTCHPSDVKCKNTYEFTKALTATSSFQKGIGEASPADVNYVAGVEDYTMLIDHSFSTSSGSMAYDDYMMQGFWMDCRGNKDKCEKKPIKCIHSKCQELGMQFLQEDPRRQLHDDAPAKSLRHRQHAARSVSLLDTEASELTQEDAANLVASEGPVVLALKDGDVLSIKTMLAMAAASSDDLPHPIEGYNIDDVINRRNETRRERGAALVISVHYDNFAHWQLFQPKSPPEYTISIRLRPAREYKQLFVSKQLTDYREMTKAYGILVVVQQTGAIRTFSLINALIVVTAAMGLLAVSSLLTDLLALYVMPNHDAFEQWKYQESEKLFVSSASMKLEERRQSLGDAS